jgi:hypothetical protein
LTHDFGIIRPGEAHKCIFRILNPTEKQWSIDHIQRVCTCTAIEASKTDINPGEYSDVSVSYRAPDKPADDARVLTVFFREADVPQLQLIVKATVRPVLTVFPAELPQVELLPGQSVDRTVMAYNFGDADWDDVVVSHDAKWLSTTVVRTPVHSASISATPIARQAWRIGITTRPDALAIGDHRASLKVSPANAPDEAVVMPVSVRINPAIRAIPDRIFLGYIGPNQVVERHVILSLCDAASKVSPSDVQLTSSLDAHVSFSWEERKGRFWHLKVRVDPAGLSGRIDESISVTVAGIMSDPLEIRLSAVIADSARDRQVNGISPQESP